MAISLKSQHLKNYFYICAAKPHPFDAAPAPGRKNEADSIRWLIKGQIQ
jgi:hypothetical protein